MAIDPLPHLSFSVDRLVVNGFHIGQSRHPLTKPYDLYANPAGLEVDGDITLHCDMNFDFRYEDLPIPIEREISDLTPRSVTFTLGWWQDGEADTADGTEDVLEGILRYLRWDSPIAMEPIDIVFRPYVRHDRPDGHAYCLPGVIEPIIHDNWRSSVYFQSECKCGNGEETGCEFEAGHLDTKGAYPLSPIIPVWDTAREEVLGFFADFESSGRSLRLTMIGLGFPQ